MEDQQNQTTTSTVAGNEQMLQEIYENTRKTKNYMKWQLIITIALVVIPLLAAMFIIPFAFQSLSQVYGTSGLLMQ